VNSIYVQRLLYISLLFSWLSCRGLILPHYLVQIVSLKCSWSIVSIHYCIEVVYIWFFCVCLRLISIIMCSSTWRGLWMWWFDILIAHDLYSCFCAHVSEIWHSQVKLAYVFPFCFCWRIKYVTSFYSSNFCLANLLREML